MAAISKLTDNSWLVRITNVLSGILFKTENGYLYTTPKSSATFNTIEEVEERLGKLRVVEKKATEQIASISGYPLKHRDIKIISEDPPSYMKETGNTIFVAGYWGLKFNNGWTQAFCPKITTLDQYEYIGPFKNKLELMNKLAVMNNESQLKALKK